MTAKEFEAFIQEYEMQAEKTGKQRPLSSAERFNIALSTANIPAQYKEAFDHAEENQFGQFDSLPLLLKTYLGAKKIGILREKFKDNFSLENEELKNYLREHAMDVSLRVGISVEKNSNDAVERETAKAFDTFMNTCMMQNTMMPPSEKEKTELKNSIGEEEANAALALDLKRQRVLAKTYFLAQLGKYDLLDDNGISRKFNVPLSETLAHGSRTNFILPAGTDTKQVIDAYMGNQNGEASVIESRIAATHHVSRRAIDKNGLIQSETKEIGTRSPLKIFGHQYGMNISAGGIGRRSPNGSVISGNGESGHAYMRIEEGDATHCGSLLIGIEGSAPGKESALGHAHNTSGVSANQSAFFSDKQIVGRKNGGRQVDLSGLSSEQLAGLLNDFDRAYAELQKNADTPQGRQKLAQLNDKLIGKVMSMRDLVNTCKGLNIGGEQLTNNVYRARFGYLAKVNTAGIDGVAFCQSVRATMTQEMACNLAEKRFKQSNDIELAVGAVKELICTHEARSFGWRLRHPILNYREKAAIKDLTNRLQTEKGFFPADIAEAMDASVDTFSMNWGEGLSHDYGTLLFLRQKSSSFGGPSTEDPIIEATEQFMKQFKKQYYKNTTEKIQERMDMEQKLMESELYEDMSIDDEDYYKMDMSDDELDELDEDELKEGADEDLEEDDPDLIEHRDRLMFSEADMLKFDSKGEISPQVSQPSKNEKSTSRNI